MTALEQAYASNTDTPILTLEFEHSSLSGGYLRLCQNHTDFTGKIEDDSLVVYSASSIGIQEPSKDSDGSKQLTLQVDNINGQVTSLVNAVKSANRSSSQERVAVRMRGYFRNSTDIVRSAIMVVSGVTITSQTAQIRAIFQPIYDTAWPKNRYYPTKFKGMKYR